MIHPLLCFLDDLVHFLKIPYRSAPVLHGEAQSIITQIWSGALLQPVEFSNGPPELLVFLHRERSIIVLAIFDFDLMQDVALCLLVHLDALTCLNSGESIPVVLRLTEYIDFLELVGHFLLKVICTHGIEVIGMNPD